MANPQSSQVTLPTNREILIERSFAAPRTVVFEAWTNPVHVARWWDPSGRPLAVCEIDLRANGSFRWINRAPDGGEGHSFTGIYREVSPPEKLVFTVRIFPRSPEPVGTVIFTEDGKKTTLTLRIECASNRDRDALLQMRIEVGTTQTLENLAAYLAK